MLTLGIDLGTTYSLAGMIAPHGAPSLFPDVHDASAFRTPSVVHIDAAGALVGQAAEHVLDDDPSLAVARCFKLKLGQGEPAYTDATGAEWSAEALSALVLRKLMRDAETFACDDIGSALITVPAQFDDTQRKATRNAAQMAGLRVQQLIDEPVAAATFYGSSRKASDTTIFVYDLGGGTFDATILQAAPDGLYVLGTEGSNLLGGAHLDAVLSEGIADELQREHRRDPRGDAAAMQSIRRFVERSKIALASSSRLPRCAQPAVIAGAPAELVLDRPTLDRAVAPLLEETAAICERGLDAAGLRWSDLDMLLLAGGATGLPGIRDGLLQRSGLGPSRIAAQQQHQAVAYGAAMLAGAAAGEGGDGAMTVHNVASFELGMRTWNRERGTVVITPLIKRNTPLPAQHALTLYTTRPDQTRVILDLVQRRGEGEPHSLGRFEFGPIRAPRKNHAVEVSVSYSTDGVVTVIATDPDSGTRLEQVIQDDGQIGDATLAREMVRVREVAVNG